MKKIMILIILLLSFLVSCTTVEYKGVVIKKHESIGIDTVRSVSTGTTVLQIQYFIDVKCDNKIKQVEIQTKEDYNKIKIGDNFRWVGKE